MEFPDFLKFVENFNKCNNEGRCVDTYDLNNDVRINFADFLIFANNYGVGCGVDEPGGVSVMGVVDQDDYGLDLEAVGSLNEDKCDDIGNLELKEFCKYRVQVFSGTYTDEFRAFHGRVNIDDNGDIETLSLVSTVSEFSREEYGALKERDSKVVLAGSPAFVVEVPSGLELGEVNF